MANILIVDDSRTSRKILAGILTEQGHTVIGEACNGREAVEKYGELKPDIVTMDITMPELDGMGALEQIMNADSKAKVVMITAAGQKEKMVAAIKLGAAEFVTKPFDAQQIADAIEKLS